MTTKARKKAASAPPPSPNNNMNIDIGEYEKERDNDNDHNDKRARRSQLKLKLITRCVKLIQNILRIVTSTSLTMIAVAILILAILFRTETDEGEIHQSTVVKIGMGYLFVARPLLSTMSICFDIDLGDTKKDNVNNSKSRGAGTMTRIIAFSFLMSIMCNQFPKWMSKFVACSAVFAFGLASRQLAPQQSITASTSKKNEHCTKMTSCNDGSANSLQRIWSRLGLKERAALGGIAILAALLIENFIIWVVSATYQPGIDGSPEPLQDNGRIVLERLAMKLFNVQAPWMAKKALQTLRDGLNVQWALVSSFGASLVCLELQLGQKTSQRTRTLAGLAFHGTMTLATARLIRTISFALTVLPSQVSNCYASHFPPPPEEWGAWLMIGFLPNTRGGCNDLILSGHATITSTLACAFTSAASNTSFSIAVWTLIALDYSIESYQGLHYSVDMWLGCIVTCLIWQLTKSLEIGNEREQKIMQNDNSKRGVTAIRQQSPLDATIVGMYALPAILTFVVLTVVPEAMINYFLVGFSVFAGVYLARYGFTSLLQHVLLCELCLGLGAYL